MTESTFLHTLFTFSLIELLKRGWGFGHEGLSLDIIIEMLTIINKSINAVKRVRGYLLFFFFFTGIRIPAPQKTNEAL